MLVKVDSVANIGLETIKVSIEINISAYGLPKVDIVGMPSKAVDESRQRVITAINNSGISFPRKRITINLAPADILKEGSCYDLPISVGIICGVLKLAVPKDALFFGEISLDGSVRHCKGAFLLALYARENNVKDIFIPADCLNEVKSIAGLNAYGVENLAELIEFLKGERRFKASLTTSDACVQSNQACNLVNMQEIRGNYIAKRAMMLVAAGGHNIMLYGPPGTGKTMLARALVGILPDLSEDEAIEVTKIYSVTGNIPPLGGLISARPIRCPHHTTSVVGLIGGGSRPSPGEVSLAHRGILFLDEFAELPQFAIDSLRQPLEDGYVLIARSKGKWVFPADFTLVAATNPCPCGYLGDNKTVCTCSPMAIAKYRRKFSGPILDRIDLYVKVEPVSIAVLASKKEEGMSTAECKSVVDKVRGIQSERYHSTVMTNSDIKSSEIEKYCPMSSDAKNILLNFCERNNISPRSYFKIIRVGRTIADIDNSEMINLSHIQEALQYRSRI